MKTIYSAPLSLAKLSEMKEKALNGLSKLESTQLISRINLDAVKDNPLSLIFSAYIPNPEEFNDAITDMRDVFGWLYSTVYRMEQDEERAEREQNYAYENKVVPFMEIDEASDDCPF